MIKLVTWGCYKERYPVEDGNLFFVVYPDGNLRLCYWSRRGYFSPEVNYDFYEEYENSMIYDDYNLWDKDSVLVCPVEIYKSEEDLNVQD